MIFKFINSITIFVLIFCKTQVVLAAGAATRFEEDAIERTDKAQLKPMLISILKLINEAPTNSESAFNIAYMYDRKMIPISESKRHKTSHFWYKISASQGCAKAMYSVGMGYFTGFAVDGGPNITEANIWFSKAAEAGDEKAQEFLKGSRTLAGAQNEGSEEIKGP